MRMGGFVVMDNKSLNLELTLTSLELNKKLYVRVLCHQ